MTTTQEGVLAAAVHKATTMADWENVLLLAEQVLADNINSFIGNAAQQAACYEMLAILHPENRHAQLGLAANRKLREIDPRE